VAASNGVFRFQADGVAGINYIVQASTNLMTWMDLLVTNPTIMPFSWSDITGSNFNRRFYRVVAQ
jgi:hypothetical protein